MDGKDQGWGSRKADDCADKKRQPRFLGELQAREGGARVAMLFSNERGGGNSIHERAIMLRKFAND